MRIEEKSLILPALYILKRDGPSTTTHLIAELTAVFHPEGEDAVILAGRNDSKFSQKVRNLQSHRDSNGMANYTVLNARKQYALTDRGERFLQEHLEEMELLFSNQFDYRGAERLAEAVGTSVSQHCRLSVFQEDDTVNEGRTILRESARRERSQKLRKAAIEHYRSADGKLYCAACGFCFEDRYGGLGKEYIEIHHEAPIFQYSDTGLEQCISDALLQVKPLCSNCHRMIHRDPQHPLSIEQLKQKII